MSLIKCGECSREISDKAEKCPQCGAPVVQPRSGGGVGKFLGWSVFIFVAVVLITRYAQYDEQADNPVVHAPSAKPAIDKSIHMQSDRYELLEKLKAQGIFGRVTCRDSGADLLVKPGFFTIDYETKQKFLGVVYAYCFDGSKPYVSVSLVDAMTNRKVGSFSAEGGLDLVR